MEFYFDIEFIKELQFKSIDSEFFNDFVKFLKQLSGTDIYLFIDSLEMSNEILSEYPLLKFINDSRPYLELPHTELENILLNEKSTGFKSFFLNSIDTNAIRSNYGYFAFNSSEVIVNAELFNAGRQDLQKVTSNEVGENNLNSWSQLKDYNYPINSIILTDRYFLARNKNLNINIFGLFDNLGLIPLKNKKIDICIITEVIFKKSKEGDPDWLMNRNFSEAYSLFIRHLNSLVGRNNYNLTILRVDELTDPKSFDFHQRILITNFFVIDSHPSFSFFEKDSAGNITVRVNEKVTFDFILWKRSRNTLAEGIAKMKKAFLNVDNTRNSEGHILKQRVLSSNRSCRLLND
jgi:hypothetical protein